jgi:CIC family chloride channel protein
MNAQPVAPSQQLRLRENQLFVALTILIGVLAGLSAVLFTVAIERTNHFFFGFTPSAARLFLVPTLVSVATGVLLAKFFPDARGSGVPQTKAAFHLHGGHIPARVPLGKLLTGVLCIGSGHSMGREGPSVQIGAGIASVIGRWVRLPPDRVRDLVPVGAAGALSAAFNTPIAAVLFALEEIMGNLSAPLLGSAVVASVSAVIVERSILGNEPLFRVPTYHLVHPAELGAYAVLGIVGGLVSLLFAKLLLALRRLFSRLPPATKVIQPAIGGAAIGALLIMAPQVMGVGYEHVDQALNGGLVLGTLILLCLLKIAATVISYASGNAGGIFAPSLFIGAMAGGAVGTVVRWLAPFPTGEPGAYAIVGMGTLFAGIIRAPLTSVFMIFEITQDYQILVPLMVANLLSFMISRRYQPTPLYHALLQQDDVHLPSGSPDQGATLTAREVMDADAPLIAADQPIERAWRFAEANGHSGYVVGTRNEVVGLLTVARLAEAVRNGQRDRPIRSLVEERIIHVHADHPLDVVLDRLAQTDGILPVLSRAQGRQLEGVITMDSIVRFIHRRRSGELAAGRSSAAVTLQRNDLVSPRND